MKNYIGESLIFLLICSFISSKTTTFQVLSDEKESASLNFKSHQSSDKFSFTNYNNGKADLSNAKQKILQIDSSKEISFNTPLIINATTFDLLMTYENSHVKFNGENQWNLISLDDFQATSNGWSKEKLNKCGSNDNMFLGGHCNFGGENVMKIFAGLHEHTMIRITANVHFFDNWEGETMYMKFNNQTVWTEIYKWCDKVMQWKCKKFGINACGAEYPDRLSFPVEFITYHKDNEFLLEFGANLKKDPCEASWGIDDVAVYIK